MEKTERKVTKKSAKRRLNIILGANKVFCKTGIKAATVDDICEEIGCSHGLFYHYYTDKSELVEYLRTVQNKAIADRALAALASSNNPIMKIKNLLLDIENTIKEDPTTAYKLYFFLTCASENGIGALTDPTKNKTPEIKVIKEIKSTVKAIEKAGYVKDNFPKKDYINTIISAVAGNVLSFVIASSALSPHLASLNVDLLMSMFIKEDALQDAEKESN